MSDFALSCPIPIREYPHVLMAHGGGGRLMHALIEKMFRAAFASDEATEAHDAAVFDAPAARMAFTTDSYVVRPLFFPGGDIGSMAVHGTVNDLAMSGARPLYLSAGFILEEGLAMETLWRVVRSMAEAARQSGLRIVTGDTKVVERGKGDGVYINTAGVGAIAHTLIIGPESVRSGDAIVVSGDLGRHGIAIMAEREGFEFETAIESDSAPVWNEVRALFDAGVQPHCLRDLTRGGLTSALNEIAMASRLDIEIEEARVPVGEDVRGACEILGFDPFAVANEGRFVVFVAPGEAGKTVEVLRAAGCEATLAGHVGDVGGVVRVRTLIGARRVLDMPSGEQLPRIC